MNKTSLAITVLAIVAATAIGLVTTQSAAAQPITISNSFNTANSATQTATQTGTATTGAGGAGGGSSGSATVSQSIAQQIAQSGAFGTSSNTFSPP